MRFTLAAMDGWLLAFVLPLALLPLGLFAAAAWVPPPHTDLLGVLGASMVIAYASIWLFLRPSQLEVTPEYLIIDFPLRSVEIARSEVEDVEVFEGRRFTDEQGGRLAVWTAGVLGTLGPVATSQGSYETYLSRSTHLVVVRRRTGAPLLLSPAHPRRFAEVVRPAVRRRSATQADSKPSFAG